MRDSTPPTSPTSSKTKSPKPRWYKRKSLWISLVGALLLYPILVTAALWSGLVEKILASEDLRVEIDNPAYSLIPGQVHLRGVHVYVNGMPQFILEAEHVEAHIRLLPLLSKRFSLSWLGADNVSYRMRLPQEEKNDEAPRTKAFPPLKGLPGENTVNKEEAQKGEDSDALWTVELRNLGIKVRELWFFEYHYVGAGELKGGFARGPNELRINTSVQELGPGKLYYGQDQVISHNFRGQIEAHIPRVNPKEHANLNFFDFVHARVELMADVVNLSHIGDYLPNMKVTEGGGPFYARVKMDGGQLSPDTLITYQTKEINLLGDGFSVKTDYDLRIAIDDAAFEEPNKKQAQKQGESSDKQAETTHTPEQEPAEQEGKNGDKQAAATHNPHVTGKGAVTYFSMGTKGNSSLTIQFQEHVARAALGSPKIDENLEIVSASLDVPTIISTDLDDAGALMGDSVKSERGEARAKLNFVMNEDKDFNGKFDARFDNFKIAVDPVAADINGTTRTSLLLSPSRERLQFDDVALDFKDVDFVAGKKRIDNWWMQWKSPKVTMGLGEESSVQGEFTFLAQDARPLLYALAAEDKVPDIVPALIKLRDIRSRASVRKQGKLLDVMIENFSTRLVDFSGRIYNSAEDRQVALLIGGEVVSLGIYLHGDKKQFAPLAHTKWLNERLERMPAPVDKVQGQQP